MNNYSPFKIALKRDLTDEPTKEGEKLDKIDKLDPQGKKVAEGLRIFQSVVRERDSLLASCTTLAEDLKFVKQDLQRAENDLAEARRQRDHYLRLLAAYTAQAQILYDASSSMMAKINSVSDHVEDGEIKALASRLGAKSENGAKIEQ